MIVDEDRLMTMNNLNKSDVELSGDVNSTLEVHNRLELKWQGTSKHVRTLQEETHAHYEEYAAKMDSINWVFKEIKFSIEQLNDLMNQKFDQVNETVDNLSSSFDSYKRTTNKSIREIKNNINTIKDDVNKLNDKVFPPEKEK
tara:strand:- start:207 stop:635 length:429 start_codon:yes stop_codon:yes gene_type:complete